MEQPLNPIADGDAVTEKSPQQMIEDGVGLIARGMFRIGHKDSGNDPKAANDAGMAAVSIIRSMALDFLRNSNRT